MPYCNDLEGPPTRNCHRKHDDVDQRVEIKVAIEVMVMTAFKKIGMCWRWRKYSERSTWSQCSRGTTLLCVIELVRLRLET